MKVEKKLSEIVNRLNKTREERKPNLQEEREERDRQERAERRKRDDEMVGFCHPFAKNETPCTKCLRCIQYLLAT